MNAFIHRWQADSREGGTHKLWLAAEFLFLALLGSLLLDKGFLNGWHRLQTDFPNYYLVARLLREGYSLDRIYDWIWLQRIKDHWGLDQPIVGFAGLTPFSALPVLPLVGMAALQAKRIWLLANALFLLGTAEAMHSTTGLRRRRVWIILLMAIIPLRASFMLGQMHVLVLFLLALAYLCFRRGKGLLCGLCVALAAALKVYPLLLIAYFAWKRRWREAAWSCIWTAALLGVSYLCFGSHVMHIYLTQILPRSMQGEVIDPFSLRAASGAAFFHRLFLFEPGLNASPLWNRPVLYSIAYPLWQCVLLLCMFLNIRRNPGQETEKLEWAAFLVLLLVLSPVPSSYHFVVLILPALLAADVFKTRQQYGRLFLLLALYLLMCVPNTPTRGSTAFSLLTVLSFSRLWIGMALWLVLTFSLWRERLPQERKAGGLLQPLPLALALCAFWALGFAGWQRHLAHFGEDTRARMGFDTPDLLVTGLRPWNCRLVAISILPTAYRIVDENGTAVVPGPGDQLSSASTADGRRLAVEVAETGGSRILFPGIPELQIPNAESPAFAADGSALAFIREEKGRGRLWLTHLNAWGSKTASASQNAHDETMLAGAPYDVRDVTFTPSGELLFTARVNGKTSIYRLTPGQGNNPQLLVEGAPEVESVAASQDGQQVVFRKLMHDRWQLAVMHLGTGKERILTTGDCNVYSPLWTGLETVAYSTDCGRGLGLTALASVSTGSSK